MLNFSASQAVSWPTPPSTAVPAVTPIAPVQPAQGAGRDAQAGLGFGQNRQAAYQPKAGGHPQGASQLPGEADPSVQGQAGKSREGDVLAQREAQEVAAKEAEQRASDKEEIHRRLREVLSNVWQASAAVVDRALGRDPASEAPGSSTGTSSALSTVAASLTARPALLPAPSPAPDPSPALSGSGQPVPMTDVVAYDEHGNGSVPPHEAGSLVDQRV
ncbi:hypothetical protein J2W49_002845 [Hydrogenophaga palleronii]|uniref:Uncharacterized protein n=1 Tax=Hydrogenophaga palleronii TaxID=65655 RepID=A0ABU1WNL9_9BURK|nr:hypothetical protein [Hydrogenophaga palleronii]MDR7150882.1 hypothetical protein [Hydrogenophaga palleronii]